MKVRLAHSTGRPEPQFIIEAETDEDSLFLELFLKAPYISDKKLKFHKHGSCSSDGKYTSFNFGWIEDETPKEVI